LVEFLPLPYPNQQSTALNSKQIYAALKQSVIVNFGDTGWGAVGSSLNGMTPLCVGGNADRTAAVKYFSPATNICIIRVARDPYRIAWGAVTYLSSIEGQKYIPNVVHVSGQPILSRIPAALHPGD
jgi:ribonuclease P/MRP protein subunit POP5